MARKTRGVQADLQLFQAIALSLATEELQQGLQILLNLAMEISSEPEGPPFNLLVSRMGYDEYDKACVTAAKAWIDRVTGVNYDIPMVTRFDKMRIARPPLEETADLTIDDIKEE